LSLLGTIQYVMNRTLLWDPQQFRRPLPIAIAPSVFAEPNTIVALTPYAQNEMIELMPEMRAEGPQAKGAIRQLLEPATWRPVVDWDAGLPPPWVAQLQSLGAMFTQPAARDRFHRHLGQLRTGRDLQGFAILWMAAATM